MNDSTKKFLQLVNDIDHYTELVSISPIFRERFMKQVMGSRRIIVTGTGTSMPTAQYLTARLQELYPAKPTYFLPTAKAIRAVKHIDSADLVVVISYGLNRADSLIILEKAIEGCATISISGNQTPPIRPILNIIIPPEEEKIFCRPISPLTTLMAIEQICGGITTTIRKDETIISLAQELDPKKQTIILYAAGVSFAAELWGIVLREGAGMNVSVKDMENYAHGYYGTDTARLDQIQYIILKSDSAEDERDFMRAKNLYEIKNFKKFIITVHGNMYAANAALFRQAPDIVLGLLLRTGYDMYAPNGMDENRKYHEYEYYKDY
ncbi:MAG: SIS domain-containing protein [Candidatus Saccharimonadales bacterium]